jgi:hypothetical protein
MNHLSLKKVFSYQDFLQWSKDASNILLDLNISFKNIKRLSTYNSDYDQDILKHGFFRHHFHQLRFIMVIQLCKVLSDNQNEKRSFVKLCNKIENEKIDKLFYEKLRNNSLTQPEFTIKSRKELKEEAKKIKNLIMHHQNLVDKIIELRNTAYAHKDPDAEFILIKMEELQTLTELSSEIYNRIFGKVDGSVIGFSYVTGWEVDAIISQLAKGRELNNERLGSQK